MRYIQRSSLVFFLALAQAGFGSNDTDALIDDHYRRGCELSESKEFSRALLELNLAMRHLRNFPQHPKRKEVEDLIVRTKERLVVERYRQSEQSSQKTDDHLLPIKFEPDHFQVIQVYGKVFARKIWKDRNELAPKEYLGEGRQITTLPGGGIEIEESTKYGYLLRSVNPGGFSLSSSSSVKLDAGSISICSRRSMNGLVIASDNSTLQVSSDHPFVLLAEISFDGFLQISSLLGRISLSSGEDRYSLIPGNRIETFTDGMRAIEDLELGSHYLKSKIIGNFASPPVFYQQLTHQARMQISQSLKR